MQNLNNYNKKFWSNYSDELVEFINNELQRENFTISFSLLTQTERDKISSIFNYATHANDELLYLLAYLPIDVNLYILSNLFDEAPTLVIDLIIYAKSNRSIYGDILSSRNYKIKKANLLDKIYKNDIFFSTLSELV